MSNAKGLASARVRQLQEGVAKWRQEKKDDVVTVTAAEYSALHAVLSDEKLLALRLHVED